MKTWTQKTGKFFYMIQQLQSGEYLAQLTSNMPTALAIKGHEPKTYKEDVFDKVEDALDYVGWPVSSVGIPAELQ